MYSKFKYAYAFLFLVLPMFVVGCLSSDDDKDTSETETAPQLTMALPTSMTTSSTTAARIALATDASTCQFNGDEHADWFDNGYQMSKFLVDLSQAQSCLADAIIGTMVELKSLFENKGKQPVPGAESDPGAPKWVNYQTAGDTSKLWLYWDDTDTQILYITWTSTTAAGYEGQMIFSGWPADPADPGAPNAVRVDFSRGGASDVNHIYMGFAADHPGKVTGFHVMVSKTGSGTEASYEAKGYIVTNGQYNADTLPAGVTFANPSFSIVTVVDSDGVGATISNFDNLALHLEDTTSATPWSLGSYQFSLTDKVYFDALGATQWKDKGPTVATYVNPGGTNVRTGAGLNWITTCLETYSVGVCGADFPQMNLSAGYFTSTCTETNGADCQLFIQGVYDLGFMNNEPNSSDAEPTDWRNTSIAGVTHLTNVWPSSTDTAETTFVIPVAP